jgi:hypothetical protein
MNKGLRLLFRFGELRLLHIVRRKALMNKGLRLQFLDPRMGGFEGGLCQKKSLDE